MKETPLLFTPENVRKILAGTKTQTRRVVKGNAVNVLDFLGGKPGDDVDGKVDVIHVVNQERKDDTGKPYLYSGALVCCAEYPEEGYAEITCPFGQPGDFLWVRETFTIESNYGLDVDYLPPFNDGRPVRWQEDDENGRWWQQAHYKATDPAPELVHEDCTRCEEYGYCTKWKPSIHMPKWACRLWLEIVSVKVERVQEIGESDAKAEGCDGHGGLSSDEFSFLWKEINGEESWEQNPWVWVIEFKKVEA